VDRLRLSVQIEYTVGVVISFAVVIRADSHEVKNSLKASLTCKICFYKLLCPPCHYYASINVFSQSTQGNTGAGDRTGFRKVGEEGWEGVVSVKRQRSVME
jgi:hypothetical protein